MTLKTVPVTGTLYNADGSVCAGATVTAILTAPDSDATAGGTPIAVPGSVSTTSAGDGTYTLNLWPNSRGTNGTGYRLRAQMPGAFPGVLLLNWLITVPDSDPTVPVPVGTIRTATLPAAPSDSKAAMLAAQGFAVQAAASQTAVAFLYPGVYATAPTTRPDGTAIQAGDRYNNSADGFEYRYIGGAWDSSAKDSAASASASSISAGQSAGSAGAAAGSAAAAAASLAAMLNQYMGSYASNPTTRPDGSALTVGCSYFNSTSNTFMVYNSGGTFQASDINTANLAAPSGASLVGVINPGTGATARTAQDKLSDQVNVFDFFTAAQKADALSGAPAIDTTAKIQSAVNAAAAAGQRVVGYGTFRTSATIVIKGDADFSQATFLVYGTPAVAVEVSTGNVANPTTQLVNACVWLPKRIQNMTKPTTGWVGQGVGVRIVNSYSGKIFVGNNFGFSVGLLMTSFGGNGCVYNNFYLGHNENNQVNLQILPGDGTSWVNENNFFGGRNSHQSAEGTAVVGTRHILISNATSIPNNNVFYKPTVEGDVAEYHVEIAGSYNSINYARWESTAPKLLYSGTSTNNGTRNMVHGGYNAPNITVTYSGTTGGNNRLTSSGLEYDNVSGNARRAQNQSSSGSGIDFYYEAGTQPESAGSSAWSMQHSAQALQGKRSADANARIKLDYVNGRYYLGGGSSAASLFFGFSGNSLIFGGGWSDASPGTDNATALGEAGLRYSVLYAATGTINTSDARDKQQVRTLSDAERAAAQACKGLLRAFKFNDAVEKKGDGARVHFGVMAQDVAAAFQAQGLDPHGYALFCYDEWPAQAAVTDDAGNVIEPERPAGDRYGVRYEELLAFVLMAI